MARPVVDGRWWLLWALVAMGLGTSPAAVQAAPEPFPAVTGTDPGSALVGEPVTTPLCFDNVGLVTGYRPVLQVILPAGLSNPSAEYLGNPVTVDIIATCMNGGGCTVPNPESLATVMLADGETLANVILPLGSITPDQPPQCVDFTVVLGVPPEVTYGMAIPFVVTPIFALGGDPLDNPTIDAPLVGVPITLDIVPSVFTLVKDIDATETAQGPNFVLTTTLAFDVAVGIAIRNVEIRDDFHPGMQFVAVTAADGCAVVQTPSTMTPGGVLRLDCGDLVGVAGVDKAITFTFYVTGVLSTAVPGPVTLLNDAQASADIDDDGNGNTPDVTIVDDGPPTDDTVAVKAAPVRKTVAITTDTGTAGPSPGDTVTYTPALDVTDDLAIQSIVLTDTLGDGQTFDGTFTPTLTVHEGGATLTNVPFLAGEFTVGAKNPMTGTTPVTFNLSAALTRLTGNGILQGDIAGDGLADDGPTQATVTFRATIDLAYTGPQTGTPLLTAGDTIVNTVVLTAVLVGDGPIQDDGSTTLMIALPTFTKTVYAVNGSTMVTQPVELGAGDTVTFRLRLALPFGSFENLRITDYLPIPFLDATEIVGASMSDPPPAGTWAFGPDHSGAIPVPTVTTDGLENTVAWSFPTFESQVADLAVDLLFTVTVTTEPFSDKLLLANLAIAVFEDSGMMLEAEIDVVIVRSRAPALTITKDIVSSSNPSAMPATVPPGFDDAWMNDDASDIVTIKVTIANAGSRDAYDVRLQDRFAQNAMTGQGFSGCTLGAVTDGNGLAVAFTTSGGGLFTGTLSFTDLIPADNDGVVEPTEQRCVTYTCTVDPADSPGAPIVDTAEITNYASSPGGSNFANDPSETQALAQVGLLGVSSIVKSVVDSSVAGSTPHTNANQGEVLTFTIVVSLGEGTYDNFSLTDSIDTIPSPVTCAAPFSCSGNVAAMGSTVTVTGTAGTTLGTITYGYTSQKTTGGTNIATVDADDIAPSMDDATWTVDAPDLVVDKTFNVSSATAGQTVQATIGWSNTDANNPAFGCVVTDVLNASVFDLTTFMLTSAVPAGYTFLYDPMTGTLTFTSTNGAVACEPGTITYTVAVRSDVVTGTTYDDPADISGTTLPAGHPNEAAEGTVSNSDGAMLAIDGPTAQAKALITTSEPSTDPMDLNVGMNPPVAIGEVLTYTIRFAFPGGTTRVARIVDVLPAGLTAVGTSGELARNSAALTAAGNPGSINTAAIDTFVPITLDTTTATAPAIALGDVQNSAPGGAAETYTLRLQCVVANSAMNNAGTTLIDTGRLTFEDSGGTPMQVDTNTVTVHVAEPVIDVDFTITPGAPSAGGTVTFKATITNNSTGANAASAFDWDLDYTLPAIFQSPSVVTVDTMTSGAVASASFTMAVLDGTIDRLDPGEAIMLSWTATVDPLTPFGTMDTSTFTANATSLPGTNGTGGITPGGPGTPDGERTFSGGVNDLTDGDAATVTVATPNLTKTIPNAQSFYPIGAIVTFRVTIALPVGTTTDLDVTDTLPAGLAFVAGSATAGLPFTTSAMGNTVTFDFGNVTVAMATNVQLEYQAQVENVLSNQDGVQLTNTVTLTFDDPNNPGTDLVVGPVPSDTSVRIGEPDLEIAKTILTGAVGAEAGSVVRWQLVVQNTGNTTAFQVDVRDVLPAGLFQIANVTLSTAGGSVFLNGTTTAVTAAHAHVETTTNTNDTLDVADTGAGDASNTIQIAAGASVTIAFDATVMNTVQPGQQLVNAVIVPYTSLVGGGRDNTTDPGNVDDDDDADLNNYEDTGSGTLTAATPIAITKSANPTGCAIGQTCTFTIRVDLPQGTTPSLIFTDSLPAGLAYVSHAITAGNMGMTFGNPSFNTRLGTGSTVRFDFGDVLDPANGNAADDFVSIAIVVRPDNVIANQNGTVLRNGENADGSETYVEFGAGPTRIDLDTDPMTPGNQGVPLTAIEPVLDVQKSALPTQVGPLDVVTYSVTAMHTGASTADAYDLVFTDILPAGLTYVAGSATLPAMDVTLAGQMLTFRISTLTLLQGSRTFTYQARVAADAVLDVPAVNDLDLVWSSQPGATGDPTSGRNGEDGTGGLNDYADNDTATVIPVSSSQLEAQKIVADLNGGTVLPGDVLRYTVTLTNLGTAVTNVVFTDLLPPQLTYVVGSLTTSQGTANEAGAPTLVVTVGSMAPNAIVTITFRGTVTAGVPAGTVISNQGIVDSDQTPPEPTDEDGNDANGDQPTDVVVDQPPMTGPLYAQKLVELVVDADASSSVTPGDTLRYTIIVTNLGTTTLTGVTFADTIPAGLAYVPASIVVTGGTGNVMAPAVSATLGSLAGGASKTITFDVTVNGPPLFDSDANPNQETFTNQGAVAANETTPVPTDANGDPGDGAQPTVITAVDTGQPASPLIDAQKRVRLVVSNDGDGLVDPGDTIEWTITITNTGAGVATDVQFTTGIPANTTLVPGTVFTSQGIVLTTNPIAVNVGDIGPGGLATVTFRTVVNAGTPDGTIIMCQGVVSGGNFPDEPTDNDGNEGNGDDPTTIPVVTDADLEVVKTGSPSPVGLGADLTYTIVVTNHGPDSAPNATLTDTLPQGATFVSVVTTVGSCSGTNPITCGFGTLANGASATVTIVVHPTQVGTLTNTAIVDSDRNDPDDSNNEDTVDTPVELQADLSIDKTRQGTGVVQAGEDLVWILTVTNHGPSDASGVVVTDPLPPQVSFVSAVASQGSCSEIGGLVTCLLGDLAVDASATVTLTATRVSNEAFSNVASVDGNEPDPDPDDDDDTDPVPPGTPETCGNCADDDLDGLVDYDDPDCCAVPEALAITSAKLKPRNGNPANGSVRIKGLLLDGALDGVDPRDEDISVRVTDDAGDVLMCCTIPSEKFMRMHSNMWGFWDQKARICPPLNDLGFGRNAKGKASFLITARRGVDLSDLDLPTIGVTLGAEGGSCAHGDVEARAKGQGAVYP